MAYYISIEGTDGCGKATQSKELKKNMSNLIGEDKVHLFSFPTYGTENARLAESYLAGHYGDLGDSDIYFSTIGYAIDRFLTLKDKKFKDDEVVIFDRYVGSNIIYQLAKIDMKYDGASSYNILKEKMELADWIVDLEHNKFNLPKVNKTIFLDMPLNISEKFKVNRETKSTMSDELDILERDLKYMHYCYKSAIKVARSSMWSYIRCNNDKTPRSIESISNEVWRIIKDSYIDFLAEKGILRNGN